MLATVFPSGDLPMQQIVKQNMKMIAAVLFILAFALPASSQAITSTADEDGTHPAILTAQSKPANSLPVVVTWDYYARPKTLMYTPSATRAKT